MKKYISILEEFFFKANKKGKACRKITTIIFINNLSYFTYFKV